MFGGSRVVQIKIKKTNDIRINRPPPLFENIKLYHLKFGSNPVLDILSDIRTENRTAPRISRTEQDRTELYGSVLPVLVLWSSSEQNFGNTNTYVRYNRMNETNRSI